MSDVKLEALFAQACAGTDNAVVREEIEQIKSGTDTVKLEQSLISEESGAHNSATNVANLIREMRIPEKIKLALFGNQTARTILIREANRMIPLFVLENPRLTENEVNEFARNKDLDDVIVRTIAASQHWMKNYAIKQAVIFNPKTPVDISLKWAKYLKEKDLRLLAKSRNIPQALAVQCRKLIEQRDKK